MRTVLYADPTVRKKLSEEFVLHWSSERPVPKVTIDFGDGRTLHRTVTGNSAHYVLSWQGYVVDALPGLYPAGTFVRMLDESREFAQAVGSMNVVQAQHAIAEHHESILGDRYVSERQTIGATDGMTPVRMVEVAGGASQYSSRFIGEATLSADSLKMIYRDMPKSDVVRAPSPVASSGKLPEPPTMAANRPPATLPIAMSFSKAAGGQARLADYSIFNSGSSADADRLLIDSASERHVSARFAVDMTGSKAIGSREALLLRSMRPSYSMRTNADAGVDNAIEVDMSAMVATNFSMGKAAIELPILRNMRFEIGRGGRSSNHGFARPTILDASLQTRASTVERNLAADAAINEIVLRPMIRSWLASGEFALTDFKGLNDRVFSKAFLTPSDDPWLGLLTPDMWTGIRNDGIVDLNAEN